MYIIRQIKTVFYHYLLVNSCLFSIELYKLMLTYQEVKNVLLTHSARRTRRGRAVKTPSTSFTLGGYSAIKSSVNRQVELCGNAAVGAP